MDSGLQLGCNILHQPKVICGRNQDLSVRPESNQELNQGSQSPGEKHIGFFRSGKEKPSWSRPRKDYFTVYLHNTYNIVDVTK